MLVAIIVLFVAIIRIRLLEIPLERDEGEYAYAGQLMLQGIPPYQLAFNMKFPGTYAAYAAIMALFGQTIAGIHLGFTLLNAGTIVLIYLLGRRLFTAAAGVASSAAYALLSIGAGVYGTQAHATHFVVAAAVGATLLLLQALDKGRSTTLLWSGLLYGVAVLMKQHGVFFAVFAGLYLIWNHRAQHRRDRLRMLKELALFFCGVSVPLALTGIALWRAGVFDKFWFWTVTYAREYELEASLADGLALFRTNFPSVVGPNLLVWMIAAAGLIMVWRKKEDRTRPAFISAFVVFSFLAVCPGFYFREHYFVLMLPAVALLAGVAVSSTLRIWPRSSLLVYGVYGAPLVFSVLLQKAPLFEMSPFEVSRSTYRSNPFPEAIQVAEYIRTHSEKGSLIAVLGSEPEIPFYADRHSATGQIYTYAMMEPQPYALTMQKEMIRDLQAAQPEYVVFVTGSTSWLRRPNSSPGIFDWWNTYGLKHYKVVGLADIISPEHTEYRWDNVGDYQPQSQSVLWVYKRADLAGGV
jgi:4-amino-4-deoxy-L-arabinose transferase-like glycosyltransferase